MIDLSALPQGQYNAVIALIGGDEARTYRQAANIAGISLGTLYTHLRRVRQKHPDLYDEIRSIRLSQLARRHIEAMIGDMEHSRVYFKRKANYRYYQRFGHWPWERW